MWSAIFLMFSIIKPVSVQLIQEEPVQDDTERKRVNTCIKNTHFLWKIIQICGLNKKNSCMYYIQAYVTKNVSQQSADYIEFDTKCYYNTCLSGPVSVTVEGTSSPKRNYSHYV